MQPASRTCPSRWRMYRSEAAAGPEEGVTHLPNASPDEFASWFHKATGEEGPFPYQETLATAPELPDQLAAPTGAGKTALVLAWLWRRRWTPATTPRRLVYCLPTRVLVEQTFGEITDWLKKLDLLAPGLGHPDKVLPVLLMGGEKPSDRWWLYPEQPLVLVGTQEMLLSRALNRGYGASRYQWPQEFGLLHSDALWVLDEVQLMGTGLATTAQLAAFRQRLGTYGPVHTLWVSATQEAQWLATVDHPAPNRLLTLTQDDFKNEELSARLRATKPLLPSPCPDAADPHRLAEAVLQEHAPGTLTLVVLNSVERAQELYRSLLPPLPGGGPELHLLHSRFRPCERRTWKDWMRSDPPPAGRIIVATQVVEAGANLDARILWTEQAPWINLVQRFGRCNRRGELPDARIYVLAVDKPDPYAEEDMDWARQQLGTLAGQSVNPETLARVALPPTAAPEHVLRRRDLLGVFDTSPDLSGNDLDVSRFIRVMDDYDVYVYWRQWEGTVPSKDMERPAPSELCPVPIGKLAVFLRKAGAWRFDHLGEQWLRVHPADLRPGQVLLLPASAGGYDPQLGWTGSDRDAPVLPPDTGATGPQAGTHQAEVPEEPPAGSPAADEGLSADPSSADAAEWQTVAEHTDAAAVAIEALLPALPELREGDRAALRTAIRWHDAGKGYHVFVDTMQRVATARGDVLVPGQVYAKSPARRLGRHDRRYFRHELASAMLYLYLHDWNPSPEDSLIAYLIGAHHGKVRLAIRSLPDEDAPPDMVTRHARGIWEGERLALAVDLGAGIVVPEGTPLDLELMELGSSATGRSSWLGRMLALRDSEDWGPFRLAFLEAVLRATDARSGQTGNTGGEPQ